MDVGGSHVKVLASTETEKRRVASGPTMTAQQMVDAAIALAQGWAYDVVSVGVPTPVRGATQNSGQRCTAVKRILADDEIAEELVPRIVARATALVVGDPRDRSTDIGTLIDESAAMLVERRVHESGGELLYGGERNGAQLVPPVVDKVPAGAELVHEETFGPAIPIVRVRGLDHALEVANGTAYGLSSGVVSNDLRAITRCIRELRCGSVNVNEVPGWRTEAQPFGGIKDSGLGVKEGVAEAMRAYTTTKLYSLPWPSS